MKLKFIAVLFIFYSLAGCVSAQPITETGSKNKNAMKAFNYALGLYNGGDYNGALEQVQLALDKDKNFIDAMVLASDIYRSMGNFAQSIDFSSKAIQLKSDYPQAFYIRAQSRFELSKFDSAKMDFESFLAFPKIFAREKKAAIKGVRDCDFSKTALNNPVPYNPINMGANINTDDDEYWPGLTVDEKYFYFTRQIGNEEFYYSTKIDDSTWSPSRNLGPPINTHLNEGTISVSSDGQYIFFTACNRPDGLGSCDIYFSKLNGSIWGTPKNLRAPVNSAAWESLPSLSFDGKQIYFSSNRPGGFGGKDIWVTTFEDNKFTEPVNLGPTINTEYDEDAPLIHQDNQTLYFSSSGWPGLGSNDLFYSRKVENGNFTAPVNMGYPINTSGDERSFHISRSGKKAFISSSRLGGFGGVDIYSFQLYKEAQPVPTSYVKGIVTDEETGAFLSASAELFNLNSGNLILSTSSNEKSGEFMMVLQPETFYGLNVNKEGYLWYSKNYSFAKNAPGEPQIIYIKLKKLKKDGILTLNNTFFDVDKFDLKQESVLELNKLFDLLNSNPKISIEISGHTDNTGNPQKNKTLSENRAKSVYNFLVQKGINPARLKFAGYGDTKPVAPNTTEEGKQLNRRVEVKILNM